MVAHGRTISHITGAAQCSCDGRNVYQKGRAVMQCELQGHIYLYFICMYVGVIPVLGLCILKLC